MGSSSRARELLLSVAQFRREISLRRRLSSKSTVELLVHRASVARARVWPGFVIFSENTPFSFLFSFSVGKFSGRKFSGSPSSTALIVVLLVQPAPEEEDLTKEGE